MPRKQKMTEMQTVLLARHILIGWFGENDIRERRRHGISSFLVISRNLRVAIMVGEKHHWHWSDTNERDVAFREEMGANDESLVCIWDENLDELLLWLAMGAPDARDWETEYSWIPDRTLTPIKRPHEWRKPSRMTSVVKHYQHDVIFAQELALWRENGYLDRRSDKRRVRGALFANRYRYVDKTPIELSDSEIIRGLRIAGYVQAYSSYDPKPLMEFLKEHPEVKAVGDPCAGWGERMLACAASGVAYRGVDVNDKLRPGYDRMMSELPMKNVSLEIADSADTVFDPVDAFVCCPPYGDIEIYSEHGAENLNHGQFADWWTRVCANMVGANPTYICITTNRKYRDTFLEPLLEAGYAIQNETKTGRSRASHFQRTPGSSNRREYETFIVLNRQ